MPAASFSAGFAALADEDSHEWHDVASSRNKKRTSAAPPASTQTSQRSNAPISLAVPSKGGRVSGAGLEGGAVGARLYGSGAAPQPHASRFATHDDTGKPLAEDYYRAFQKCFKDTSGDVILRFHRTDIVKVKPSGEVQLATGKYYTFTTMCSINDALQFIDMKLQVTGDVKDPSNWVVTSSNASSIKYEEHMCIKPRGPQDRDRGMEILTGMRALLESTSQAHADKVKSSSSGDQAKRAPIMLTHASKHHTSAVCGDDDDDDEDTAYASGPTASAEAPIVVPLPSGPAPPLQLVAGSAWAAKGSLAARLAAETAASKPAPSAATATVDFPPLSTSAPSSQPHPAAQAAAPANAKPAAAGAARPQPAPTTTAPAPAASVAGSTPPPTQPSSSGPATEHSSPASSAASPVAQQQQQPPALPAAHRQQQGPPGFAPVNRAAPPPPGFPPAFHPGGVQYPPHHPATYQQPPHAGQYHPGPTHGVQVHHPAYTLPPPFIPAGYHDAHEQQAGDGLRSQLPDTLDEVFGPAEVAPPPAHAMPPPHTAAPPPNHMFGGADPVLGAAPTSKAISAVLSQSTQWDGPSDDTTLCVVCMHHKCDTILIPCSHAILCKGCADMVINLTPGSAGECPVCRSSVDLVLDVM